GAADDYVIPPERLDHWAWKPPGRRSLPPVKNLAWVKNPIDGFILAKLEAAGIAPAAPASREQLIRRMTFDLIGLPPTPPEIDAFAHDPSPAAFEKVIDRLLASPHYGERWGRHWLDVARFAESNGYEYDEIRPDAWRYRDYIIRSFNADKPYDRFIREQLAGDELYPEDADALVATGFNLLGPAMTDSSDQALRRQNTLNDMTDTTALAFLGLTLGCARCHDHKFEPIPQTDYYRLQAFFTPAVFRRDVPIATGEQRAQYEAALQPYTALVKPAQEELAKLEEPYRRQLYQRKLARLSEEAQAAHQTPPDQRTAAQKEQVEMTNRLLKITLPEVLKALNDADRTKHQAIQERIKQFDGRKPAALPVAMGLHDAATPPPRTFLLKAGELGNPAEEVQPGYPIILVADHQPLPARGEPTKSTGRRAALAQWIANRENPATARVMVNRIWQHHFGRGIVPTSSDVGVRGERPTHPELLDWLASEFVASGWSIKAMQKMMLLSATHQQSPQA